MNILYPMSILFLVSKLICDIYTSFIGRMAAQLKEPVRIRILPVALLKAMRDPFLHCRLAGIVTITIMYIIILLLTR